MLSADDFIDAVEAAGVLNESEIADLRRAAAEGKAPTALAAELVSSGALTNDEASAFLAGSSDSSTQLSASDLLMPSSGSSVGDDSLSGWRSSEDVAAGTSNVLDSRVDLPPPSPPAGAATPSGDEGSIVKYDKDYEEALSESMHGGGPSAKSGGGGKRRKHLKKAKSNEFDSPLILLGGGGLVLLVLCGVGLAFLLNQESGDELLQAARSSYESRSYSQAIAEYERFVEDFTTHANWSSARVQLATARIRQAVETARDNSEGLRLAQQEIPLIEDEPAFSDAQGELASLLPKIATGLSEEADAASREDQPETVDALVEQVNETLTLIGNTKYVPKSLRDQGEIDAVGEMLVRINRRRQASRDLREALAAMADATEAGDPRSAYQTHRALIDKRPEVADDDRLTEAIRAAAEAERATIRFVADRVAAVADERPSPIVTSVVLANRRVSGEAEAEGVFVGQSNGVAYGVRAATGEPLWRRPIGASLNVINPTPLDGGFLLADHENNELILVESETGKLRWRAAVEAPGRQPLVIGQRILLALESGRLLSFDAASGERLGYAEFAQPLRAAPVADERAERVYLTGEHSSLYVLDGASLECIGVEYLGHSPGSIAAPPTVASGRLIVLENVGLDTCHLRVFRLDADGMVAEEGALQRLDGACDSAPLVKGRRVMVATRKGEVKLLELTDEGAAEPLTVLATRPVGRQRPGPRFLAAAADSYWIADVGLTRSAASLADSRLLVQRLEQPFNGDTFVGPLVSRGAALLHSRRRKGQPGVTLAATNARTGAAVWEVDLGSAPLDAPTPRSKLRGLVTATKTGESHLIDRAATRRGVSDRPIAAESDQRFDGLATLADGVVVLTETGSDAFALARPGAGRPTRRSRLPGALACRPVPLASGWLAPIEVGQVLLVSSGGRPIATPFQPPLTPGRRVAWRPPAVAEVGGETLVVIADDVDAVYCLAYDAEAARPALDERSAHRLAGSQPLTGVAIASGRAALGVSDNQLALFDLPLLGEPVLTDVGGPIRWGPHPAADSFVVGVASGDLVVVNADGRIAARGSLPAGKPLGVPAVDGDRMTVVLDTGAVVTLSTTSGDVLAQTSLGEPAGSGPTSYGSRLLISAADASILVVEKP